MNVQLKQLALLGGLLAILLAGSVRAAPPYEETVARKHWYNFWIRPAKDNPHDQLAYAEQLRTAGHLRAAGKQYRLLTVFLA